MAWMLSYSPLLVNYLETFLDIFFKKLLNKYLRRKTKTLLFLKGDLEI